MAISQCDCHSHGVDLNKAIGCKFPILSYEGAVLQTWENNGYDDSDFLAAVWDEDTQKVKSVTYATTRGWTYHNGASVDATNDVLAKAKKWLTLATYKRLVYKAEDAM